MKPSNIDNFAKEAGTLGLVAAFATLGGTLLGLLRAVPILLARSFVALILWEWFILPMGVVFVPTLWHLMGMIMLSRIFVRNVDIKTENNSYFLTLFLEVARCAMTLLVGYLLHVWFM